MTRSFLNMPNTLRAGLMITAVGFASVVGAADSDQEKFFETRIRPLLANKCVSCHGPGNQEAEIRLDSRQQVLVGSNDADPLVNPKDVAASRLLQVVLYSEDDTQMPPKGKLSDREIADIRQWITSGAYWPENHEFGNAGAVDKDAWRQHWAFQPIADPPLPKIHRDGAHPIDSFIRRTLAAQSISPSPRADAAILARRISYAVTGLPPHLDDVTTARTLSDSPERDVWLAEYTDKLIATPQFGERWGRYWLDIARYADTKGYVFQEDREYPDAWRYREWVIRSLNDDMPYDDFLRRQIAADRLPGSDDPDQLAAMGFFTLGRRFLNNTHDIIDDRIDVLSRGTMALTVSCARCHDHKFDPIPTADYYSLYGVFNSSEEPKNEPSTLRLVDRDKPREPVIFVRGNARNRGERISRHFLTALSDGAPEPFTDGSGRLELANEIASSENPLTARVAVNRIWMRLFGRGLVESPSDFGVRTPPPTHPELLDHLATWFIQHDWSRKALIRYIMQSETWRQSSVPRPELATLDPENRLVARMPDRRLDFEAFRDSVLAVCGQLDSAVGGQSVDITTRPFATRRTVYARIDRQNLPGTFRTFDFSSPDSHAAKRFETTVPQQALFQLNSPFMMAQAEDLIQSLQLPSDTVSAELVTQLYQRILRRNPEPSEQQSAVSFLAAAADLAPKGESVVGWQYGWGEINSDKSSTISFQRFPVYHDKRWSGGEKLPDSKLGWCMLNRTGGHTGGDLTHCPIRRWIANQDCTIEITSTVRHSSSNGDGVAAHILYRGQSLASTHVHNSSQQLGTSLSVRAGEIVDLVADCRSNESHDSFNWTITIDQSVNGRKTRSWESEKDFSSAMPFERLSPAAQLAQALLLTNEFMFVD